MEMRKWKVEYEESNGHGGSTTHTGYLDRKGVIDFFGLDGPDIVWYKVTEITGK